MSSNASNFMEDADDQSFIRMRKSSDRGDGDIADLVVINASDVDVPTIGWFADEHAMGTSNKTICTLINEGIFGTSDISLTHPMHGHVGDHRVCVMKTASFLKRMATASFEWLLSMSIRKR